MSQDFAHACAPLGTSHQRVSFPWSFLQECAPSLRIESCLSWGPLLAHFIAALFASRGLRHAGGRMCSEVFDQCRASFAYRGQRHAGGLVHSLETSRLRVFSWDFAPERGPFASIRLSRSFSCGWAFQCSASFASRGQRHASGFVHSLVTSCLRVFLVGLRTCAWSIRLSQSFSCGWALASRGLRPAGGPVLCLAVRLWSSLLFSESLNGDSLAN